jgi:putative membrane protein
MEQHPEIRATDTLANERTFLAYIRTALSFVAFGFVIARFSLFTREISIIAHMSVPGQASTIFGVAVATTGIIVGLYGAYRYVAADRGLHRGVVVAMPEWVAVLCGLAVGAIGIVVAVELLALR